MNRINVDRLFDGKIFNDVVDYARRNIDVNEAQGWIESLNEQIDAYEQEKKSFISEKLPIEENFYSKVGRYDYKKNLFKIGAILLLILNLASNFISFPSFIVRIVKWGMWICIILFIHFNGEKKDDENRYKDCTNQIIAEANQIKNKYKRIAQQHYVGIDNAYLSSLDSAHREMVLMRREQAQQHKELMKVQEQHLKELEKEQKKVRELQEELLRIEREREKERKERGY